MDCFRGKRNQTSDNRWYSPVVRMFALTLFIFSPAAYRFVREKFNKTLPATSTFCRWYAESNLECQPGILKETINALRGLVNTQTTKTLFASLSFDEVAIRKHLQWIHDKKKWSGYINYGKLLENNKLPLAHNVLVFMVTILDHNVSLPIAYYAITSLDATEKKLLLLDVLQQLSSIGVKITNIVFDGLSTNLAVANELGASFDLNDLKPFFINPSDGSKVYILLDACHMIKLIRNALGDLRFIKDPILGSIKWLYFEALERCRVNSKFVTNRMTKRHIQYFRNRMSVRLAVQTFSNSVCSSMKHLRAMGNKQFQKSLATIGFVDKMNKIFDVMNTKRVNDDQVFKSALNKNNANVIFSFFDEMLGYLKSLKFRRKLCIESRRKTGFLGFVINMCSIKLMYQEYVVPGLLTSLALFYHSQDPLESFFSRIRYLCGSNNNPTIQQFQSSIRKLLFFNEVKSSELANCEDSLNILTISSRKQNSHDHDSNFINFALEAEISDENELEDDEATVVAEELLRETEQNQNGRAFDAKLNSLGDSSIAFFAGSIEKAIFRGRFCCAECLNIFRENEKIDGPFFDNNVTQKPCKSTFLICKCTHIFFDGYKDSEKFNYDSILKSIKDSIEFENLFENTDFDHEDGIYHKKMFVDAIIDEYIRMYGTYIARCITLEHQQKLLRSTNNRAVIFNGQ